MSQKMNNDREIYISVANSRSSQKWRNKKTTWSRFVERCSNVTRTSETLAEYKAMPKPQQSERKDVGGFVGGYLTNGLRKKSSVEFRDVLALDIDYAQTDTWDNFTMLYSCAAFAYGTHNYTAGKPRIRLIILLSRSVTAEEYEAVARSVASQVGIDLFDDTTYQPERLMYWPSIPSDGEWYFQRQDGDALNPDEILANYHDWHDVSEWAYSSRVAEAIRTSATRQGDPLEKPGIVGAFCRCYDIYSVIDTYLSDVYERTDSDNRYTFRQGTVAAGLVVYEGGKFAYSHNATDPCSQHLCNAFDLVRMHKFGYQDEDCDTKTAITSRPSYRSMAELAAHDNTVRRQLTDERRNSAITDFSDLNMDEKLPVLASDAHDKKWMDALEYSKNGKILSTIANAAIILEHAPEFRGKLWHDDFSGLGRYDGRLPWSSGKPSGSWMNADDSCLRKHLEKAYGITGKERIADALTDVMVRQRRHPVRNYLRSLTWDGVPRLGTLFIDFLGAEDTEIVRQMTRKHFTAAVSRVMSPGCKYDYMLVLVGDEGIGKSTILRLMSQPWYNDSLTSMDGKEGMEPLRQSWIIEVGELMGIKRSEVESIKAYLSRQVDTYRPSYGRCVEEHPRQCVFFGTTNERNFLKGQTGNRRFWVIETHKQLPKMDLWHELTQDYRDQVWAEAVHLSDNGEELFLDHELENEARRTQEQFNELHADDRLGIIERFLDTLLPTDWDARSLARRRAFFKDTDPLSAEGCVQRNTVSAVEILYECFGEQLDDTSRYKTREINALMKLLPSWTSAGKTYITGYGRQRTYKRIEQPENKEKEL